MIRQVKVDGFYSLSGFRLVIRPGLNILVGPNGAGKTNIIIFFEFLSALHSVGLRASTITFGGPSTIFRKTGRGDFQKDMSIEISGETISHVSKSKFTNIKYQYRCTISVSEKFNTVYFSSQEIRISAAKRKKDLNPDWDVVVVSKVGGEDLDEQSIRIERIDFKKIPDDSFIFAGARTSRSQRIKEAERFLFRYADRDLPLTVHLQRLIPEAADVSADFVNGHAFSIDPSSVKKNDDRITPPEVRKDGGGVAATLHALLKHQEGRSGPLGDRIAYRQTSPVPVNTFSEPGLRRISELPRRTFSEVEECIKVINDEIDGLIVKEDHDDNQFKIYFDMKGKDGLRFPFSFMSDGTAKWAALVTTVLTKVNMLSIEEPENFIHPVMQQEALNLMREAGEYSDDRGHLVLMSTHSETLLNAARPNEIIVVSMKDGVTKARRLRDIKAIDESVRQSGFGLGYFYLTGVLDDA